MRKIAILILALFFCLGLARASVSEAALSGSVTGINASYKAWDTVSYTVSGDSGSSNVFIDSMYFKVIDSTGNSMYNNYWYASYAQTYASQIGYFYTSTYSTGWKAGTYSYTLTVQDNTRNTAVITGSFAIEEIKPTGNVVGISASYRAGDTVSYTVSANSGNTHEWLKYMDFKVTDSAGTAKHSNHWYVTPPPIPKIAPLPLTPTPIVGPAEPIPIGPPGHIPIP